MPCHCVDYKELLVVLVKLHTRIILVTLYILCEQHYYLAIWSLVEVISSNTTDR